MCIIWCIKTEWIFQGWKCSLLHMQKDFYFYFGDVTFVWEDWLGWDTKVIGCCHLYVLWFFLHVHLPSAGGLNSHCPPKEMPILLKGISRQIQVWCSNQEAEHVIDGKGGRNCLIRAELRLSLGLGQYEYVFLNTGQMRINSSSSSCTATIKSSVGGWREDKEPNTGSKRDWNPLAALSLPFVATMESDISTKTLVNVPCF